MRGEKNIHLAFKSGYTERMKYGQKSQRKPEKNCRCKLCERLFIVPRSSAGILVENLGYRAMTLIIKMNLI